MLKSVEDEGKIKININFIDRSIVIEDNGTGLSSNDFLKYFFHLEIVPKEEQMHEDLEVLDVWQG